MPLILASLGGLGLGLVTSNATDDIKNTVQWIVIGGIAYLVAKGTKVI